MSRATTDTAADRAPPRPVRQVGDRVFAGTATGAGILILVVLAGVAVFLIVEAWPALTADAAELPGGHEPRRLHRAAALRHGPGGGDRPAGRDPAGGRASPCSSPTTRPAGSPSASATSSTCSPRSRASSTASGASPCSAPASVGLLRLARRAPRLHPVLRRPRLGDRPHDAHRRPRAGGHDPADHHRDLAARCSSRRRAARGGGAGPRRDPLGDDPDGGAAVRPLRHRSAARCSASAARWARRWPSRSCCRCPASSRFNLISSTQPVDDRGEHRAAVPRVVRARRSTR